MALAQEQGAAVSGVAVGTIIDDTLDQIEKVIEPDIVELEPIEDRKLEKDVLVEGLTEAASPIEMIDTKVIPLLHAEASTIVETLEGMRSEEGVVSYNGEDRTLILKDLPEQLKAMAEFVKGVDIPLETKIYKLDHVKARDILREVVAILTNTVGQAQVVDDTNSIVVTDTPLKVGEVTELIDRLDYANREVVIEAKVLRIILNDEHIDGVDWEAIVSDYQSRPFPDFYPDPETKRRSELNFGAVTKEDLVILLDALDTVGVVNEISDLTVTVDSSATGTVSVAAGEEASGKRKVDYYLTPMAGSDGMLEVEVEAVLKNGSEHHAAQGPEDRILINVAEGATIVIGSLFEKVNVESSWKIPLLGDLPFLGFVFRNQGEVPRKAEIITFLTLKAEIKE